MSTLSNFEPVKITKNGKVVGQNIDFTSGSRKVVLKKSIFVWMLHVGKHFTVQSLSLTSYSAICAKKDQCMITVIS